MLSPRKRNQAKAKAARAKAVQAQQDRPRKPSASQKTAVTAHRMGEPVGRTNLMEIFWNGTHWFDQTAGEDRRRH